MSGSAVFAAEERTTKESSKDKDSLHEEKNSDSSENHEKEIIVTGSWTDIGEDSSSESINIDDNNEPITPEEKEQVKKDLNEYIIESYKVQGTKILKELDIKLQKSLPEAKERREAYKKILISLELREKRLEKMKTSQTKKIILKWFLDHMIDILEKKMENLEK